MKIGIVFGNPETTTGGNALKFYSSLRIEIRKGKRIENGTGDDKVAHGNEARIRIVKNKIAPPFKTAKIDIMFNEGISKIGDLVDTATKMDIVQRSGAFYSYAGTKLGQGKQNTVEKLKSNPDLVTEIEKLVRKKADI